MSSRGRMNTKDFEVHEICLRNGNRLTLKFPSSIASSKLSAASSAIAAIFGGEFSSRFSGHVGETHWFLTSFHFDAICHTQGQLRNGAKAHSA